MWDQANLALAGSSGGAMQGMEQFVGSWGMALHGLFWLLLIGFFLATIVVLARSSTRVDLKAGSPVVGRGHEADARW